MNWNRLARQLLSALAGLAVLAGAARAQELARNDFANGYQAQRLNLMVKTSDIIGTMVWDKQGHRLGRIEDFLVDADSWRVLCALVRPVNLYGPTQYYVGVPAKCFATVDPDRAVVDATVTNFIGLPRFRVDASHDAAAMSASLKKMFDQFGQKIYWDEKKGLDRLVCCGVWMNMDVTDGSDVNVGRLADFVIDLPAERVVFAAVAFFGWDANTHVMPPGALSVAPDGSSLVLAMDATRKAGLLNADDFMWVKATDPAWVASVYRAYGEQLNIETGPSLEAAVAKAREPIVPEPVVTPTVAVAAPQNQLTRAVMTAIVRSGLENAEAAQNVKAMESDGDVTLTGQVSSEQQKLDFGKIAKRVTGDGRVTNQLEVK